MPADILDFPCPFCGRTNRIEEAQIPISGEVHCPGCLEVIHMRAAAPSSAASLPRDRAEDGSPRDTLIRVEEWEELHDPSWLTTVACPRCGHRFDPEKDQSTIPKVLIVEDTEFFLHLANDILGEKYETAVVKTVADAQRILRESSFDLILLDLTLSDGDGIEVLGALPRPDIPVLLYTSRDETSLIGEEWQRLRALGANDVIHKGLNIEEAMLRKVEDLLAGAPGRV
ncbi:MAG: response regulator [Acidobacteriota bacterium]|nr:response regulator [Acidobacteriota bacterium]